MCFSFDTVIRKSRSSQNELLENTDVKKQNNKVPVKLCQGFIQETSHTEVTVSKHSTSQPKILKFVREFTC